MQRGSRQVTVDIHSRVEYAKYFNPLLGLDKIRYPIMAIQDYSYFPIHHRLVSLS